MAKRTVLMFHGLGGDKHTMSPIAEYCGGLLANTQFLSIEGPVNLGDSERPCLGWFEPPKDNDRALNSENRPRFKGLKRSLAMIHRTLDQLIADGTDPLTIHLFGHSQGGAIAVTAGLTYPKRLGGVCTIAAYLALTPDMQPSLTGTHFHLHHSEHDDNVGFRWAEYASSYVERIGNPCTVRSWDIRNNPHSIHSQQLNEICKTIAVA